MPAFRIAIPREDPPKGKRTARVKRDAYRKWVGTLPCVIRKRPGVEVAHISFARPDLGHLGRGKQSKASDRWVLPLAPDLHAEQHGMNEREFWRRHDIDPHLICLVLWGLWSDYREDATPHALRIILGGIRR